MTTHFYWEVRKRYDLPVMAAQGETHPDATCIRCGDKKSNPIVAFFDYNYNGSRGHDWYYCQQHLDEDQRGQIYGGTSERIILPPRKPKSLTIEVVVK